MTTQGARRLGGGAPQRLSTLFAALASGESERISFGTLAEALGERGFGAILVLFSLPNVLPLPPGSSAVLGVPLALVAAQLLIGRPGLWLPRVVRERSLDRATFRRIAGAAVPWLQRAERWLRPRAWLLPHTVTERLVGALALAMAFILVLPLPFANMVPALSVAAAGLGLVERDGVWLGGGVLLALATLAIVAGLATGLGAALSGLV